MFQYNRLPFCVETAPAIYQQTMDTILSGIPGVTAYLNDVLSVAATSEELYSRTEPVLERIQTHGLRLRPEKY